VPFATVESEKTSPSIQAVFWFETAKTMGARKKQTETTGTQPMEEKPMRGAS